MIRLKVETPEDLSKDGTYVGNNACESYIPDNRTRGAASWRAGNINNRFSSETEQILDPVILTCLTSCVTSLCKLYVNNPQRCDFLSMTCFIYAFMRTSTSSGNTEGPASFPGQDPAIDPEPFHSTLMTYGDPGRRTIFAQCERGLRDTQTEIEAMQSCSCSFSSVELPSVPIKIVSRR